MFKKPLGRFGGFDLIDDAFERVKTRPGSTRRDSRAVYDDHPITLGYADFCVACGAKRHHLNQKIDLKRAAIKRFHWSLE
jgi:hypothetical protein